MFPKRSMYGRRLTAECASQDVLDVGVRAGELEVAAEERSHRDDRGLSRGSAQYRLCEITALLLHPMQVESHPLWSRNSCYVITSVWIG